MKRRPCGAGCETACERDALRAEVRDLKARLKAVRRLRLFPFRAPEHDLTPTWKALRYITDLRKKHWTNWRKP